MRVVVLLGVTHVVFWLWVVISFLIAAIKHEAWVFAIGDTYLVQITPRQSIQTKPEAGRLEYDSTTYGTMRIDTNYYETLTCYGVYIGGFTEMNSGGHVVQKFDGPLAYTKCDCNDEECMNSRDLSKLIIIDTIGFQEYLIVHGYKKRPIKI